MVSPSGMNWNLLGCRPRNTFPRGGRGSAKRWMRNGDTLPFAMRSIQTVQTFPMYLFNEMHTDSEHIAVPHPPQCAHWGTFPPGEGIALHHPYKFQFIGCPGETDKHNFQIIPEGDTTTYILYLVSSHIFPPRRAPRGTLPGLFYPGLTRYSGSAPGFFPAPP